MRGSLRNPRRRGERNGEVRDGGRIPGSKFRILPPPHNIQKNYFVFSSAASSKSVLNSAASVGEQTCSRISNHSGCNLSGNLSRAFQGFVYIFGSLIVNVNSRMSLFTRWNVSC